MHETTRNTVMMTLRQAADETGKSKPTILRAIQSGKISAEKDAHGEWQIDPAELFRVYERVPDNAERSDTDEAPEQGASIHEAAALRRELELRDRERRRLEDMIDDLRQDRDHWREQTQVMTRLLTDQRAKEEAPEVQAPTPEPAIPPKKGFMRRLFGGRA